MGELKDKIDLLNDINKANKILNNRDIDQAIEFITNQGKKDMKIGIFNSPLNPIYTQFTEATPQQILDNVTLIRNYLAIKESEMEE